MKGETQDLGDSKHDQRRSQDGEQFHSITSETLLQTARKYKVKNSLFGSISGNVFKAVSRDKHLSTYNGEFGISLLNEEFGGTWFADEFG
eukprot:Awhi_evm2s2402